MPAHHRFGILRAFDVRVNDDQAAPVRERLRVTSRRTRRNAQMRQGNDKAILEVVLGRARQGRSLRWARIKPTCAPFSNRSTETRMVNC